MLAFPGCVYFFLNGLLVARMLNISLSYYLWSTINIRNTVIRCYKRPSLVRANSSLSYCVNLVRTLDHENYLCSLLLPDNLKIIAFALRAFNIEVSRIQEQVTEKNILPWRFKFWEDSLNDVYSNKPPNHPVLLELSNVVKKYKLSKMFLSKLVSARANQFTRSTFNSMEEMEEYAKNTNAPIYMLLLEASGVKDIICDHVAAHLGTAQGVSNLIRALPYNAKEQLIMFPMSVLSKHNISEESLFRMKVEKSALSDVVFEIASVANKHLNTAQSLQKKIPQQQRSIFLPAVAVASYLKKLENIQFDVFHKAVTVRNPFLPVMLYWHNYKRTF